MDNYFKNQTQQSVSNKLIIHTLQEESNQLCRVNNDWSQTNVDLRFFPAKDSRSAFIGITDYNKNAFAST